MYGGKLEIERKINAMEFCAFGTPTLKIATMIWWIEEEDDDEN